MVVPACPWKPHNPECKEQCVKQHNNTDPQKHRLYCWEEWLHREIDEQEGSLTLDQCRSIVEKICLRQGIQPPGVSDGRGARVATSLPTRIKLPKIYRERISTIHEACHVLSTYHDPDAPAHGPIFIRYLVNYLPEYVHDFTCAQLARSASKFGLDVAPVDTCKPPPYDFVRPLIQQSKIVLGFQLLANDKAKESQRLRRKKRSAQRRLATLVRKVQRKIFPGGLHERVEQHLRKMKKFTPPA